MENDIKTGNFKCVKKIFQNKRKKISYYLWPPTRLRMPPFNGWGWFIYNRSCLVSVFMSQNYQLIVNIREFRKWSFLNFDIQVWNSKICQDMLIQIRAERSSDDKKDGICPPVDLVGGSGPPKGRLIPTPGRAWSWSSTSIISFGITISFTVIIRFVIEPLFERYLLHKLLTNFQFNSIGPCLPRSGW